MSRKNSAKGTGASAARGTAATLYDGELEDKLQDIMDDASRTSAAFKTPGRLPVSKVTVGRSRRKKASKFNVSLIKRVVIRIQARMIGKLRARNNAISATEAREMLPKFDRAWVKKNAPLIEHIAVLQMREEVRRMSEHRNTRLSDQPASVDSADSDLKDKRIVICNTEADLKNKELVLAGSLMTSHEYVRPPDRAKFLGTMRKFMAQHEARQEKSAPAHKTPSQKAAQRSPAVPRDAAVERGIGRDVEREMEVVT